MKNSFFTVLLLFFMSFTISAQTRYSILLGGGYSNWKVLDYNDSHVLYGIESGLPRSFDLSWSGILGLNVQHNIGHSKFVLGIEPAVKLYNIDGSYGGTFVYPDSTITYLFSKQQRYYLGLPVVLSRSFFDFINLGVGIAANVRLNSQNEIFSPEKRMNYEFLYDFSFNFDRIDIGIRYMKGLTNIIGNSQIDRFDYYTRAGMLYLNYHLNYKNENKK
jgi:hypothetical protein